MMNTCKTMVLMVTLSLMLVGIGAILGGKSGMTIALIIAFGMNFISYWFSDKIVDKCHNIVDTMKCQEIVDKPWCHDIMKQHLS